MSKKIDWCLHLGNIFFYYLYLNMCMVYRHRYKLGQALAEPHGDISLHVDGKRFEPFLQTTDCEVTQTAHILAKVNTAHLRQSKTAHRDKA